MAKINLNALAKDVAEAEGGKVNLTIAQVKEVIKLTLQELNQEWASDNEEGVVALIKKSVVE